MGFQLSKPELALQCHQSSPLPSHPNRTQGSVLHTGEDKRKTSGVNMRSISFRSERKVHSRTPIAGAHSTSNRRRIPLCINSSPTQLISDTEDLQYLTQLYNLKTQKMYQIISARQHTQKSNIGNIPSQVVLDSAPTLDVTEYSRGNNCVDCIQTVADDEEMIFQLDID